MQMQMKYLQYCQVVDVETDTSSTSIHSRCKPGFQGDNDRALRLHVLWSLVEMSPYHSEVGERLAGERLAGERLVTETFVFHYLPVAQAVGSTLPRLRLDRQEERKQSKDNGNPHSSSSSNRNLHKTFM
jgi:hypothetical protein